MKTVYVFCPSHLISGGPEALHQMVFYLNKLGVVARLVYSDLTSKKKYEVPEQYKLYVDEYYIMKDVKDEKGICIVLPETLNFIASKFNEAGVYIWWLGIGNTNKQKEKQLTAKLKKPGKLLKTLCKKNRFLNLVNYLKYKRYNFTGEKENIIHLCASHYTFDYVKRYTKNECYLCIEPISYVLLHSELCGSGTNDSDIILYNPARCQGVIDKIKKLSPELVLCPLEGYTQEELVELYQKSKLYIDFGDFPGAERIPKEAVINGCCIMTSRSGAAAFYEDVPIPEKYKFNADENDVQLIIDLIKKILNSYDEYISDFREYSQMVYNLEENFEKSLKEIFSI